MNCIINAARTEMIGATLYLCGVEVATGEIVPNASSCAMCKRMIINAGLDRVIIRNSQDTYTTIVVRDWVFNDDTLKGILGY